MRLTEKKALGLVLTIYGIVFLANVAFWGLLAWVVIHFAGKYW